MNAAGDQVLSVGCFFFKSAALLRSPVTAMPHGLEEEEMGEREGRYGRKAIR